MVDNPTKIYNDYVRANLPNSMSYDTGTDRYDINNHSFFKFKNSNWYYNYISKYGYSALSAYAVNELEPALVFDFKNDYYRKVATDSTFPASITHAASTNATMVDSDGFLKWRPHNNITKSNTFSTWGMISSTAVDNAVDGPTGIANTASTVNFNSTTSYLYNLSTVAVAAGGKVTLAAWVRSDTITSLTFAINGRINPANNTPETNLAVTSTWTLVTFEATVLGNDNGLYFIIGKALPASPPSQIGEFEMYGVHMYRSDLGGMVNNSETGNSYVPTTTAAVYGPRVGHHIYNGTAWVNEGILHESEARTNLFLQSNHLNTTWIAERSSVTAAAGTSPSGLSDAWRFTNTSTTPLLYQNNSYVVGEYTVSAWVKSNGAGKDGFRLWGQNTAASSNLTATSEWVRYSFTFTVTSAANGGGGLAYASGTNDVDVLVYGLQLEAGSTPSSYIPTEGFTVTRAADLLTVPAANLPYPTPVETTGTELVANGDFLSGTTGWVDGTTYSAALDASSGKLLITTDSGSGYGCAIQDVSLVAGKMYRLTGSRRAVSGGNPAIGLADTSGAVLFSILGGSALTVTNDFSVIFVCPSSTFRLCLFNQSPTNGNSSEFDNISVKEVNPLAVSIQIDGKMTYADSDNVIEVRPYYWILSGSNYIYARVGTSGTRTGQPSFLQRETTSGNDFVNGSAVAYAPGINVPFNFAGRYGSTFINGAVDGTALTANTNPTILPDLSSTDLNLGFTFMGTIGQFRMWDEDLTDAGIAEAST